LIVGIGNPGKRYENTRHNAGFMFLDYLSSELSLRFLPSKHDYYFAKGSLSEVPFALIKPVTYVNLSGNALEDALEDLDASIDDILVVHDEINLEPGTFKIKLKGSDGGHNGISSIIYSLGSGDFTRLRIGIGRDFAQGEMADFVLSRFEAVEMEAVRKTFETCFLLAKDFITSGTKGLLDSNSKLSKL
jgi:PTH1 family peptidyl-tRNA hydrolase